VFTPLSSLPGAIRVPGGTGTPTDVDVDGKYEDVNGNGRDDFADVVLSFNSMSWIAANEPTAQFDYNENGWIDFADVVWPFNHLELLVEAPTPCTRLRTGIAAPGISGRRGPDKRPP
jgi:hypothetical protein